MNISCDSLRPDRFNSIRRRGDLATVLGAMDAAEAAGLVPLKVNVVILRGQNDDEILDFAAFARDTGRIVRFIEFMPLDAQGTWDNSQLVAGREIFEQISARWPLDPNVEHPRPPRNASRSSTVAARSASSRASRNPSVARAIGCDSRPTVRFETVCSQTTNIRCEI